MTVLVSARLCIPAVRSFAENWETFAVRVCGGRFWTIFVAHGSEPPFLVCLTIVSLFALQRSCAVLMRHRKSCTRGQFSGKKSRANFYCVIIRVSRRSNVQPLFLQCVLSRCQGRSRGSFQSSMLRRLRRGNEIIVATPR